MRTAIISTHGNEILTGTDPRPSGKIFYVPGEAKAKAPVPRKKARRQRDFIVRYDGKFICHFRARSPLAPKEAFARIAGELKKSMGDFRPDLLVLFQPVRIATRGASSAAEGPGGELTWFKG